MEHIDRREVAGKRREAHCCWLRVRLGRGNPRATYPRADQPPPVPPPAQAVVKTLTPWENLDSWITPDDKFFGVGHYEWPAIDAATWLDVVGQVQLPHTYTLNDLKARPRLNSDIHAGMFWR